jgi:hypothetical protein
MDTERTGPASDSTGDLRVDEAVSRLARLREAPLDEHPPVLEAVHDRLREILGELGTVPPGGATPRTPRGAPEAQGQQGEPPGGATPRGAPEAQGQQGAPRPARPGERGQQGELGTRQ